MACQNCLEWANYIFYKTSWILSKTGFLGHNFGFRYASKSIKGCKDANNSLVSKTTLRQKNCSLDWRPGPGKVGQKCENIPHCVVTSRILQLQNEKLFFNLWRTFLIRRWFEQLSSSIGWRDIALQSFAKKWRKREVKEQCQRQCDWYDLPCGISSPFKPVAKSEELARCFWVCC